MNNPIKELPEQYMLRPFLDLVAPKGNWKERVDATIDAPTSRDLRELFKTMIERAVDFYLGGGARITDSGSGKIRVTAPGYYTQIGA